MRSLSLYVCVCMCVYTYVCARERVHVLQVSNIPCTALSLRVSPSAMLV